ncbi:MAG TPA: hypothetical protein ENI85_12930 [Deltaproteobacteria bacterium]|nr:hypothetical protein [Deltaproteobacteria bacterium]
MNGVSCRALGPLFDGARDGTLSLEKLIRGLDVSLDHLARPSNRIPWDVFVELMERLEDQLGGPEGLRRFGEEHVAADSLKLFKFVGRALSHPRDIYLMGARWMGPSLFPMTTAEMSERPDGTLIQTLTINEGHRACPALFHILHGSLVSAPVALGHGRSEVLLDLDPCRAIYTIRPQTTSKGWPGRIFRSVRARIAFPSMLRELEKQQATLQENYREIHKAHDEIAAQAADLERVNAIGRQLSEHIDLDRVTNVLIRVLLEELGFNGVELSLKRSPAPSENDSETRNEPPRFFRRAGIVEGTPSRRYDLKAAGRPLGALHVWCGDDRDEWAPEALLDRLVPWISMALDNARTYESLERYTADLEQRVEERTARLLSANHHLVREIEERKRATDALIRSEAQLRASERLASIGTLAAGIAHEINNPIGSILAAAQLAQLVRDGDEGDDQVAHSLADIVTQARRCGEIVRSILQFSRDERTEKWACRLSDIVGRSIRLTQSFASDHDARVHLDLPDRSPWARVNPIQIEQALVNLIRNAIESGSDHVNVSLDERASEELALIEIRDDGPGVAPEERLRIFEPFYTTRRSTGGTGLGLSVVHGIATEHRGALKIDSASEGGASILLELPTCPEPTRPFDEKPDPADPTGSTP